VLALPRFVACLGELVMRAFLPRQPHIIIVVAAYLGERLRPISAWFFPF
jgi:hypothetical protein